MRYKVGKVEEIPDEEMRQYEIADTKILVVNQKGHFYALSARCGHAGAPLVKGNIKDYILTCPWQGSQFKITDGSIVKGPAEKPLPVYPIEVEEGYLFVKI